MIYYVTHEYKGDVANRYKASKIIHDLQIADTENTYICPLTALSHVCDEEIGTEQKRELRLDLLCACDALIVASPTDEEMTREIELAKKLHMEVKYI